MSQPIITDSLTNKVRSLEEQKRAAQGVGVYTGKRPLIDALPTVALDGDEAYFQSSGMATNGNIFHFRYNAGSASTYKWEILGGSEISTGQVDPSTEPTLRTTRTYDTLTGDLSLTVPLAGDYRIRYQREYKVGSDATGLLNYVDVSGTLAYNGTNDTGFGLYKAINLDPVDADVTHVSDTQLQSWVKTGLTANTVITARHGATATVTASGVIAVGVGVLSVIPVRVSA